MKKILLFLLISFNVSAITFGVVPQQSPSKLLQVWMPIVQYLENETGEKIVLKLERSISNFEQKLYAGAYDIAYLGLNN